MAPASGHRGRTHSEFDVRIMRMPAEFARGGGTQIAGLVDWAPRRDWAREVRGRALDCGHYVPEERPQEVAAELEAFFVE